MKLAFKILMALLLCMNQLSAQKKEIDFNAIKSSKKLGQYGISNDGNFIWYFEMSDNAGNTLHVSDTKGKNSVTLNKVANPVFTADSKRLLVESSSGITVINLKDQKRMLLENAINLKVPLEGDGRFVFYTNGDVSRLRNLYNNEETSYKQINNSYFNQRGTVLVLQTDTLLYWLDLNTRQKMPIFQGNGINNIKFNNTCTQIAFWARPAGSIAIYGYDFTKRQAKLLVADTLIGSHSKNLLTQGDIYFSQDDEFLFFKAQARKDTSRPETDLITKGVNVWSYKDKDLQSEQRNYSAYSPEYLYAVNMSNGRIIQIEDSSQSTVSNSAKGYILVRNKVHEFETYWNGEITNYRFFSLYTGKQSNFIPDSVKQPALVQISPTGKYITWLNPNTHESYCYTIKTGRNTRITPAPLTNREIDPDDFKNNFRISGWLKNDKAIIGYDNYDVWRIDPDNSEKPVCITGQYGKRYGIQFRPIEVLSKFSEITDHDTILLTAMEVATKYSGYRKVSLYGASDPGKSFLGPYLSYFPGIVLDSYIPTPLKAANASSFLFQRQSDDDPNNLFVTTDFKNYKRISDIKPLEDYKSYQAELVQWKSPEGRQFYGILYKPEDLDTTKKYPILLNYYEERSFERYQYKMPGLSPISINVAWYLSRDYAVFIPDVYRQKGETGTAALESVLSGAEYLTRKYRWIDKYKMGLQGHSHAGYLTNYIVTHSNLFAAAQSSAGYSDFISGYGQLSNGGSNMQFMQEVGQNNLGTTPWQQPQVYIDNSCIFSIDNVATPLLIMHNKGDNVVHFGQAVELFSALRRAGKTAWLLEYDNEDHVLSDPEHVLDFTTRQQQFFDHYLKGAPAPAWMIKGIPAVYKGIRSGLQIEQ